MIVLVGVVIITAGATGVEARVLEHVASQVMMVARLDKEATLSFLFVVSYAAGLLIWDLLMQEVFLLEPNPF